MHACNSRVNLENATLLLINPYRIFPSQSNHGCTNLCTAFCILHDSIVEFLEIIGPLANKAWNI